MLGLLSYPLTNRDLTGTVFSTENPEILSLSTVLFVGVRRLVSVLNRVLALSEKNARRIFDTLPDKGLGHMGAGGSQELSDSSIPGT